MGIESYLKKKQSEKYITKLKTYLPKIKEYQNKYKDVSNEELKSKILEFKENKNSITTEKILEEVYAITSIVIKRIFGYDVFDVQFMGAIALNDKTIAEMKTGEGKTITSSLPVILNAIFNKVHVVTVNEYLAKRDKEELEKVYKTLGLSVGINLSGMKQVQKREAYDKDIMYTTASELGFDYLRDNMVTNIKDRVNQSGYNFVIIDEVDLVLIDEARTPLIIGKGEHENIHEIKKAQKAVERLNNDDYIIEAQTKAVVLTESGEKKINDYYRIDSLYSEDNIAIMYRVNQALLANFIYKKDVEYTLAKEKKKSPLEVVIIDTFTGRLYFGRRYTNGLHQAIEAKHYKDKIEIQDESKTTATITLQNFFRLYKKLSGMTGTAKEEAKEFFEIYGLNVVSIPPNKPMRRIDYPMILMKTKDEKWNMVVHSIKAHHEKGRPVLIGTVSVEDSEELSRRLKEENLSHSVLNAKQDKQEANIIAKAGHKGAITVATNMAGRGTDIKVDEDTELVVMITELNESLRIDNQLKGRTSRQGNPGITETIISLEDSIFEKSNMSALKRITIVNPIPKTIENMLRLVQEELESANYAARNSSLKYDDVIREQRVIFYKTRNNILENEDKLSDYFLKFSTKDNYDKIKKLAQDLYKDSYEEALNRSLREILLYSLDSAWVVHIDKLEALKSGVGWRSYNGSNPIITYQNEAQFLWDDFIDESKKTIDLMVEKINDITEAREFSSAYNSNSKMRF